MRHLSFLPVLLALAACAPAVTHGPRVDRGVILTATGGAPRPLCATGECVGGLVPTLGGGVRAGWVPNDGSKPAFQLGATVPLMDPLGLEIDLVPLHVGSYELWRLLSRMEMAFGVAVHEGVMTAAEARRLDDSFREKDEAGTFFASTTVVMVSGDRRAEDRT